MFVLKCWRHCRETKKNQHHDIHPSMSIFKVLSMSHSVGLTALPYVEYPWQFSMHLCLVGQHQLGHTYCHQSSHIQTMSSKAFHYSLAFLIRAAIWYHINSFYDHHDNTINIIIILCLHWTFMQLVSTLLKGLKASHAIDNPWKFILSYDSM